MNENIEEKKYSAECHREENSSDERFSGLKPKKNRLGCSYSEFE